MALPLIPGKDDEAAKTAAQSIAQIKQNPALYGATEAEMLALDAKASAFSAEIALSEAAKNAQNGAIARKDAARLALEKDYRALVARIHANPGVTDEHKRAAGIVPHDAVRTFSPPPAPIDLVVTDEGNGTNALAWSKNGAPDGTDFLVEAKIAGAEWQLVGAPHGASFVHTAQKPGTPISYRVTARRGKLQSLPCPPVGLYGG